MKVPVSNSAEFFQKKVPLGGFGVVRVLKHTRNDDIILLELEAKYRQDEFARKYGPN